jgi:two-component system, OmpR family, phosphate regulon sensor histidine kinase PhoR
MSVSITITILVAAVAAAIGAALTALRARGTIRAVTRTAESIAAGDLAARVPGDTDGDLGRLGDAINHVARDLSGSIAALRAERDLLAGILDGMGEGVLLVGRDERIVLANQALRGMALIGDDAVGRLVLEAIRSAALKEALDDARAGGEPAAREIELGRVPPRRLLVRASRLPAQEGESKPRGVIAVFHDVTDLRRLETIRTDFVANVSHELRTPVTAISTAAETLLGGALDDPTDALEFVGIIDRHALRLRHLVDDLLDLSKLEAKGYRLALADLDLGAVIAHTAALLEEPARKRRMSVKIEPTEGLQVRADRRAVEQVVMNLLENAIKYAGEGAHVTLRARACGDHVELAVADDGVGIPSAHLGRLFERFYRVDAGRSRELGGTGLGLSIVKHLVELMGGSIRVESEPGRGACFTIRLQPASASSPSPSGQSPSPSPPPS